ncbi:MAG TPA: 50S ribosomal protein L37ae [Candidatus Nanoarchaeia archaeon]|nr:50S ribosomal protein L37ae [Candidatus Nanoarchaeia archaeon]
MPVSLKYGSTKRFGARYGRRIKEKLGKIELIRKQKQMCPYCAKQSVVRKSYGIWNCRHCGAEFTGYAYSVSRKVAAEEQESQVLEATRRPKKEAIEEEE